MSVGHVVQRAAQAVGLSLVPERTIPVATVRASAELDRRVGADRTGRGLRQLVTYPRPDLAAVLARCLIEDADERAGTMAAADGSGRAGEGREHGGNSLVYVK